MRKSLSISFFVALLGLSLQGQTYNGSIFLRTQAQVDSFPLNYPDITRVSNALVVGDTTDSGSDITSLSALPHFQYVGQLIFSYTPLSSLGSFAGVDTVYQCWVQHQPLMYSLQGLNRLKLVQDYFVIQHNDALPSLAGLDSLEYSAYFFLLNNAGLLSLEGASQLKTMHSCVISHNPRLKQLSGMPSLWRIGIFEVSGNDSLEHFGNFPLLDSVFTFEVSSNPRLLDFAGFENGPPLRCNLTDIVDNPALVSLQGLERFRRNAGLLQIKGNPLLQQVLHLDNLREAGLYISGASIDTIRLPAWKKGVFTLFDCPALLHLHNVFPVADSLLNGFIHDNPALLSIHEDAGPRVIRNLQIGNCPALQSITGFDSTRVCAMYFGPNNTLGRLQIDAPNLVELSGFRQVRTGGLLLGKAYPTLPLERIDAFDHLETALGGIDYAFTQTGTAADLDLQGPRVLSGFYQLRRCLDGPLTVQTGVQDTLVGFQLLDTITGVDSRCRVGWPDTCYVDPAAFSAFSYTEGPLGTGHSSGPPWPLPSLKKVYRNTLQLYGYPHPAGFEGAFPQLEEVGAVTAGYASYIQSLRGLEGISLFDDSWYGDHIHVYLAGQENLSDCSAICTWIEEATFVPPNGPIILDNPLFPCTDKATVLAWCDTVTAVAAPPPVGAQPASGGLWVYPNPVSRGMLYFHLPEGVLDAAAQVRVYDMQGRAKPLRIAEHTGSDYAVPVGDWPAGSYVLQVQTRERVWAATVRVER